MTTIKIKGDNTECLVDENGVITVQGDNIDLVQSKEDTEEHDSAEELAVFFHECQEMIDKCKICTCNTNKSEKVIKDMDKKLSITTIKNDIVDELLNNEDILNYLRVKDFYPEVVEECGIRNEFVYDYGADPNWNDYITVDVSEFELDIKACSSDTERKYAVTIKMGLEEEEYLSDMANVVVDIVNKFYPNRTRFRNETFSRESSKDIGVIGTIMKNYTALNRMIKFEIED